MPRYLSRESEPLGNWKGVPIYLTTIVVAVMVLGMVVCAVLESMHAYGIFHRMTFWVPRAGWENLSSLLWYPLIDRFNFFTPFSIFCMYGWMIGIESHMGRSVLVRLLLMLVAVPALVVTVLAYGFRIRGELSGNFHVFCGLVVGFATLYPNLEWHRLIPFKYVAVACVFCGSLMSLKDGTVIPVLPMWAACLAAFFYIRHALEQEYDDHIPLSARIRSMFRRKPKFRVVRREAVESEDNWREREESDSGVTAEVDAILDKVARSGKDSLTAAERKKLEEAREALIRRDKR